MLALLLALISQGQFIFAAPGAVYVMPMVRSYGWDYTVNRREMGWISIAGPLANIAIGASFLVMANLGNILGGIYYYAFIAIGLYGFRVNLLLAAFNLLPFGPLDGRKIFSWNPIIWAIITIPVWAVNVFLFI